MDIGRQLGKLWKEASEEDKAVRVQHVLHGACVITRVCVLMMQPYLALAAADKTRYTTEVNAAAASLPL